MRITDHETYFLQRLIEAYHDERGSFPNDAEFYEDAASVAKKLSFSYDGWLAVRLREIAANEESK